jgi:DNA-binding MarR family transcriptional regulator
MASESYLLLQDQLCFPIYATSRMVTKLYQPHLDKLNLTYPQYLVMMVLWEQNALTVSAIGERLFLKTNTITPLLKNMKDKGLLDKVRSIKDERIVIVKLSSAGKRLKEAAEAIPLEMVQSMNLTLDELKHMRQLMWKFLDGFK